MLSKDTAQITSIKATGRQHLRRFYLQWALTLAMAPMLLAPVTTQAEEWPSRPIRLIVAFPAGGFGDVVARSMQTPLSQALNQPIVIENRGGAGGNVAAAEVVRATDGHTLLLTASTTESVNPFIYARMPFDVQTDLQHVGIMAKLQSFLFARPNFPASNLNEFITEARKLPKLNYGSAGTGTNLHLAGELMNRTAGFQAVHAPYRGAAAALQDVAAGQIDFAFGPATAMQLVQSGKLKLYGIASKTRSANYPDVPTLGELGHPAVQVDSYFVVYAPSNMSAATVRRLNVELNRILERPEIKTRYADLGAAVLTVSPADSKRLIQEEQRTFADVLKTAGIKAD